MLWCVVVASCLVEFLYVRVNVLGELVGIGMCRCQGGTRASRTVSGTGSRCSLVAGQHLGNPGTASGTNVPDTASLVLVVIVVVLWCCARHRSLVRVLVDVGGSGWWVGARRTR